MGVLEKNNSHEKQPNFEALGYQTKPSPTRDKIVLSKRIIKKLTVI